MLFQRRELLSLPFALMLRGAPNLAELDSRGRRKLAVGLPNSPDSEVALVEPEGVFSPGPQTYGIYLWLYDPESGALIAATREASSLHFGLTDGRVPMPWTQLAASGFEFRTEVANVFDKTALTNIAAARAIVRNDNRRPAKLSVYAALRPIGPSAAPVKSIEAEKDAIFADGRLAVIASSVPQAIGVSATDNVAELALRGAMPEQSSATSAARACSAMMRFDLTLRAGESRTIGVVCPLRATNPHSELAASNLRKITADRVFRDAAQLWKDYSGRFRVTTPDARWGEALSAMLSNAAIAGVRPDSTPAYVNLFQKTGQIVVSEKQVTASLAAGADPGGLAWILTEQWLLARDFEWLKRLYPTVTKLAGLLTASKDPAVSRIAGLRYTAMLAEAYGQDADVRTWRGAAQRLFDTYDTQNQSQLKDKGVLWPWRLYPATWGPAFQQLKEVGKQTPGPSPAPLEMAHQALLAGSRKAGHETITAHLDLDSMRGWYQMDPAPAAEMWHLMRDSLVHEEDDRLVLFAGIPEEWFQSPQPIRIEGLPTHYGISSITYTYNAATKTGDLKMEGQPPRGHLLRIPRSRPCKVYATAEPLPFDLSGDCEMPRGIWRARVVF